MGAKIPQPASKYTPPLGTVLARVMGMQRSQKCLHKNKLFILRGINGPKFWCTEPLLDKSKEMDKHMSKIQTQILVSKKEKKQVLGQLIVKIHVFTLCSTFQRFLIQNFQRFSLSPNCSNSKYLSQKSVFSKQVRILPEID